MVDFFVNSIYFVVCETFLLRFFLTHFVSVRQCARVCDFSTVDFRFAEIFPTL